MKKLIRDIKVGDTFRFPTLPQSCPELRPSIHVTSVAPYGDSNHSLLVNDWVYDKMIEVEIAS